MVVVILMDRKTTHVDLGIDVEIGNCWKLLNIPMSRYEFDMDNATIPKIEQPVDYTSTGCFNS